MIKKLYGMEAIKQASLQARSLDAVTLSFVATFFKLTKPNLDVTNTDSYFRTYGTPSKIIEENLNGIKH